MWITSLILPSRCNHMRHAYWLLFIQTTPILGYAPSEPSEHVRPRCVDPAVNTGASGLCISFERSVIIGPDLEFMLLLK
jgi:hypothetical protein